MFWGLQYLVQTFHEFLPRFLHRLQNWNQKHIHIHIYPELGDAAIGYVGSVGMTKSFGLSGRSATGSVGTVSRAEAQFPLTGNQAAGSVGTVGPVITLQLSGVTLTGRVGDVLSVYWKLIDDSQTANWQNVNNAQTSGWQLIDDSQANTDWELVDTAT